jgi:hypothetical protein
MFHSFQGRLPEADSLHSKMQFNGRSDVADYPYERAAKGCQGLEIGPSFWPPERPK